jgi:methyl-accepting chemotaxis protein
VIQLDELTQQNAALVEQASASSLAMADQARGLNNLMHFFHVARETGVVMDAEEPQQRSTGSAPGGVERRKSDRPWSGGGNSALARARRAGGAEAPDQGWKNF